MIGSILGDIAGSRFEFSKPTGFDPQTVRLFGAGCTYTDDTVLTLATKYALINDIPFARAYGRFGRMYRRVGYGTMFQKWLDGHGERGYGSFGNGAAMRVSYIPYHFDTLEKVEAAAKESALCTYNHPEGIKGAVSTAGLIWLARQGESKKTMKRYFHKKFGYTTEKPLWAYRPFGKFDATAAGSMPLAFRCFYESESWESCIRNVFSVKCDTDTVACIAGGIAEAYYKQTIPNADDVLRRYLIKPNEHGRFDTFLYDLAVPHPEKIYTTTEDLL